MADPTPYSRTYSFTDYQSGNPSAPLPGVQVDNELENIEQSLGEAIDAIGDIRRSDGKLNNGVVTVDSLSPQVAAGVGTGALASAAAAAASADASSDSAVASAASATAAAGSATTASGYAGNALTSRNEAETERTLAQTARTGAQTARDYANKWATEAEDVNVDDGVNPVGKSAFNWAQKAAASAASVGLPSSLTANTVPVTNAGATAREDKTFAEFFDLVVTDGSLDNAKLADVPTATFKGRDTAGTGPVEDLTAAQTRNLLDPLRGFSAGGADDTANFTALRTELPSRIIDLDAGEYEVTALPDGPFENGYAVQPNADGEATVRYMMPNTLPMACVSISPRSQAYKSWPQDGGYEYSGVIRQTYNSGSGHGSADQRPVIAASDDGGHSWPVQEVLYQGISVTSARECFAAGQIDGQELLLIRFGAEPATDYKLIGRRLYQRRDQTISYDIETTSGSPNVKIKKNGGGTTDFGVKVGDRVTLFSASGTANGVTLSGIKTVASVASDGITVAGSGNASSTGTATITIGLEFLQDAFAELQFSAASISAAIIAASASISNAPTMLHGLAPVAGGLGQFYSGLSLNGSDDGGNKAWLLRVDDVLSSTRSIGLVKRLVTGTDYVEVTVCRAPNGDLFGGVRTQSSGTPAVFWWSSNGGTTIATFNAPANFAVRSPIPMRVVGTDLHGCLTGTRVPGSGDQPGYVPVYWLSCSIADFKASVMPKFTRASEAFFSNTNVSDGGNAVGVPSMFVFESGELIRLGLVYSTEHPALYADYDGQPGIDCVLIDISSENYMQGGPRGLVKLPSTGVIRGDNLPNDLVLHGWQPTTGGIPGGTGSYGVGLICTRSNVGVYDYTFVDLYSTAINLGHTEYSVTFGLEDGQGSIAVTARSSTGFTVTTQNSGGSPGNTNRAHSITVRLRRGKENVA